LLCGWKGSARSWRLGVRRAACVVAPVVRPQPRRDPLDQAAARGLQGSGARFDSATSRSSPSRRHLEPAAPLPRAAGAACRPIGSEQRIDLAGESELIAEHPPIQRAHARDVREQPPSCDPPGRLLLLGSRVGPEYGRTHRPRAERHGPRGGDPKRRANASRPIRRGSAAEPCQRTLRIARHGQPSVVP
jgi:hypothetical protein